MLNRQILTFDLHVIAKTANFKDYLRDSQLVAAKLSVL